MLTPLERIELSLVPGNPNAQAGDIEELVNMVHELIVGVRRIEELLKDQDDIKGTAIEEALIHIDDIFFEMGV